MALSSLKYRVDHQQATHLQKRYRTTLGFDYAFNKRRLIQNLFGLSSISSIPWRPPSSRTKSPSPLSAYSLLRQGSRKGQPGCGQSSPEGWIRWKDLDLGQVVKAVHQFLSQLCESHEQQIWMSQLGRGAPKTFSKRAWSPSSWQRTRPRRTAFGTRWDLLDKGRASVRPAGSDLRVWGEQPNVSLPGGRRFCWTVQIPQVSYTLGRQSQVKWKTLFFEKRLFRRAL